MPDHPLSGQPLSEADPTPTEEAFEEPETLEDVAALEVEKTLAEAATSEAAAAPESSFKRLLGVAAVSGILLGVVAYILIRAVGGVDCVDGFYQPIACSEEAALATLVASAPLAPDQELVSIATELCPDITAEVHTDRSDPESIRVLCLAAVDGSSWLHIDTPSAGSCLRDGGVGPRHPAPCDSEEAALVVLGVITMPEVPDASRDVQFEEYLDFLSQLVCEDPGTPIGPSFFEWRAGASYALCVTLLNLPGSDS